MKHPVAALCLVLTACSPGAEEPINNEASGPPEVRSEVVERHAEQLDVELGARPAGSQREQIASQYVLGHLQRAGYLVSLDSVPVGNLVESTNLLALPPSEDDPKVVVTAPYDSPEGRATGGEEVGFLLELARAFNAASPGHDVEFVALAADSTGGQTERLGSRRLVKFLLDEEVKPAIVQISDIEEGDPVEALGPLGRDIVPSASPPIDADLGMFAQAGLQRASVLGDPEKLGALLIDYLEQAGG
jgi:hypothetical protein